MLSWFYSGGFSGTSFVWENCFSRTGTASACAPSARRQHPCCRLLQWYIYSPLRKRFYKCRSGRATVRSRRSAGREFFLLQKQTFQKLWPLRALEFEARLLLPSFIFQNKNLSSRSACGGQRDDLPPGSLIFQTPLRQLSKVCDCFADAWVWKAIFAPKFILQCRRCRGDAMILKLGGGARAAVKNLFIKFNLLSFTVKRGCPKSIVMLNLRSIAARRLAKGAVLKVEIFSIIKGSLFYV